MCPDSGRRLIILIHSMQPPLRITEIGLNLHDDLECIAGYQTVSDGQSRQLQGKE